MKLTVLAVSHKQFDWLEAGCQEYCSRMPRELPLITQIVRPTKRGGLTRAQIQAGEAERLRAACPKPRRLIVLDERGRDLTTADLAKRLARWQEDAVPLCFVIGGADGVADDLKAEADELIRLSSLTLPHGLARLVLCEQLYRAVSILKNHPYHREG